MRIWGHRYSRDLQRYNLALRMIAHEVRTHTICDWTGLPDDRIRNLYQSYYIEHGKNPTSRRRGPSPKSLEFFFVSARSRSETAAVVGLCYLLDVLPGHVLSNPRRELPSIARGERLCEAYDMYQALVPGTLMSLEHVVLLIMTVAQGHEFHAGHCVACGGVIVIDRSSLRRLNCTHCGDRAARGDAKALEATPAPVAPEDVQRDLFADANQRPEKRRIKK